MTAEIIETNEFQTKITEELLSQYPDEVREQFLHFVHSVPYIQNLISPNRKRAKDLPRDSKGRIIVDLVNPHIIEDIDYFRESAIHFEKHGCYTFLRPNGSPNSNFRKWLEREARRCLEGYVRESDGEWVTGIMYYYLNYSRLKLSVFKDGSTKVASRVEAFPEFWEGVYLRTHYLEQARYGGLYNNFEGGLHCAELARRGAGKSFTLASIMAQRFVLGEGLDTTKDRVTILLGYLKEYIKDKDGTISKYIVDIDFVAEHTEFPRARIKDSLNEMIWKSGYKDAETGVEKGTLNTVMGVAVKDDESKARGKRGYILIEEFGSFPSLLALYNTLLPSVEDGEAVNGLIYALGTAGSDESEFYSAQELMYNPDGYKIYGIPNVYDEAGIGKPKFCYFFPGFINRKGRYNKDGISDVVMSLLDILKNRYNVKYNSDDPDSIVRTIAENPITPKEAILKSTNSIFPIAQINDRLGQLEADPNALSDVYVGEIVREGLDTRFVPSNDLPIRIFPHKSNKIKGAIEFFTLPIKDSSGKPTQGRYIAAMDPYDNDQADTASLGSFMVLDLFTDQIVCEYTGRPERADLFYETCCSIALFYNCKICYENNKKGLFSYCSQKNMLFLLEDSLPFLTEKQLLKAPPIGNTSKGIPATTATNAFARERTREWLMKSVTIGENTIVSNLYNIKGIALLKELIAYNSYGNFDRVSCLGILMLYREQKMIDFGENPTSIVGKSKHYKGNDKFFKNNYDKRFLKH